MESYSGLRGGSGRGTARASSHSQTKLAFDSEPPLVAIFFAAGDGFGEVTGHALSGFSLALRVVFVLSIRMIGHDRTAGQVSI